MEDIEKTVFLSYRRTNIPWALAIFQNLTPYGYDVFFDYSGIASESFESVVLENVRSRTHFLVLLTPSALEGCSNPEDWMRREIETALASQRNIVPLMLEGFDFGTPAIASQLTGSLAPLRNYNALRIPAEYFLEAMGRLRDRYLTATPKAVLHRPSAAAREAASEQQCAAQLAPAVAEGELTAQQWFELGFNATDPREQERFYTEAIRLVPTYAEAFNNRGVARNAMGNIEAAMQDFNQALQLKPADADVFLNRGKACADKGDLGGALENYNAAIRLKPDYAQAYYNRGIVNRHRGDIEAALHDYEEAIRLKPDYANALNNRAYVRFLRGDVAGALRDYDEAIRHKPDFAEALDSRGSARQAVGDLDGALQDFNEAIRLRPDLAEVFYDRGNLHRQRGDLESAVRDYDEALRLDPHHTKAKLERAAALTARTGGSPA